MTLAPTVNVGARPHRVTLQNPNPPVPNADGSYTETWTDLVPFAVWAAITASPADVERATGGTTTTVVTHVITIPFHPQVTVHTRVLFNGRRFNVNGVTTPEERQVDSILLCEELQ